MPEEPDIVRRFEAAVATFLDARAKVPRGAAVVVGVSGGADSVALLDVLRRLAREPARAYRLTAAHLHHGLRAEAGADAAFVADLAGSWDIPCIVTRRDVPGEARAAGVSFEQAARAARYDFLQQAAAEVGAAFVAVAHHADDNAETILHRILRGTHLRGLRGIPATRPLVQGAAGRSPQPSSPLLIRPFLDRTREEIESYCRAAGLSWRTDATNLDTAYRRNFLRHELLPLLRSRLNPRVDEALLRLASAAEQADDYLAAVARAALAESAALAANGRDAPGASIDAARLAREHPLIQSVALRLLLEGLGAPLRDVGADLIESLRDMLTDSLAASAEPGETRPSALSLPGGWTARREAGRLRLRPPARASGEGVSPMRVADVLPASAGGVPPAEDANATLDEDAPDHPPASMWPVPLACPGRTGLPDGRQIDCRIEPFDPAAFARHCAGHRRGEEWLDADKVRGRLLCRPRQTGDAFHPLGSLGRQSVSDFLTNAKLPAEARADVLCLCDEEGIVCLAPLRIDERVRVTGATKAVLRLALFDSPR